MKRIRQAGVVLISILVLVALAAVVAATLFFDTAIMARRTAASLSMEQALQLGQGAEALAAYALGEDKNQEDTANEDWAQPYGPTEIENGVGIEAQLTAEQGKFNINSLIRPDGKRNEDTYKVFLRLLELCGLEPRWADTIYDWIDADSTPGTSGGEDGLYLTLPMPHLTANQPINSISELLQMPGFNKALYDKLEPHITALPPTVMQVNVCTADGLVLDSLFAVGTARAGYVEHSTRTQEDMDKLREGGCFPRRADLVAVEQKIGPLVTERSSYFMLQTWIDIGSAKFALYSLMYRDGTGKARAVTRSLGTK